MGCALVPRAIRKYRGKYYIKNWIKILKKSDGSFLRKYCSLSQLLIYCVFSYILSWH